MGTELRRVAPMARVIGRAGPVLDAEPAARVRPCLPDTVRGAPLRNPPLPPRNEACVLLVSGSWGPRQWGRRGRTASPVPACGCRRHSPVARREPCAKSPATAGCNVASGGLASQGGVRGPTPWRQGEQARLGCTSAQRRPGRQRRGRSGSAGWSCGRRGAGGRAQLKGRCNHGGLARIMHVSVCPRVRLPRSV